MVLVQGEKLNSLVKGDRNEAFQVKEWGSLGKERERDRFLGTFFYT